MTAGDINTLRRQWYTNKSAVAAAVEEAVHTNPEDPLDSCNVVLLDNLRSALLVSGGAAAREKRTREDDDGRPTTLRFSSHRSNAKSAGKGATLQKTIDHRGVIAAAQDREEVVAASSAGAVALASSIGTAAGPTPQATKEQAHASLLHGQGGQATLFETTHSALLSPCFNLSGDELRLVAAHMKRIDRVEAHRGTLTSSPFPVSLSETELMYREMRSTVAARKDYSRDRK